MIKKVHLASLIILIMILVVSCAPKPAPTPTPTPIPATAEPIVEEVGTDISDVNIIDDELDTSELDGVDGILAEIENI